MKISSLLNIIAPLALFRLGFGGGGSSSQNSSTTTNNTTNNTDGRIVADSGAVVAREGSTVTMTDLNSVKAGTETAQLAVVGATKLATEANAATGKVAQQAIDSIGKAYETANKMAQDTFSGNKTLSTVGVIVAALIGLSVISSKSKKA